MIKILLIDKHAVEKIILRRNLKRASYPDFEIEQIDTCSDAASKLLANRYDIVLLENSPETSIFPEFSVPFIRAHLRDAPIVIISDNINAPYLQDPDVLGVDHIVEKSRLPAFMLKVMPIFEAQTLR